MTYIVNDNCIKCKLTDCVDVCPVDCFYEGKNMLVIKPDECIDCGVCEPECPVDAIVSDTEDGSNKWLEVNTKYSEIWPNINKKRVIIMTYIVNDKCIKCKLMDCVEVCPVDCFYEGKNMLVIKPDAVSYTHLTLPTIYSV